jgi:hypothetical protein
VFEISRQYFTSTPSPPDQFVGSDKLDSSELKQVAFLTTRTSTGSKVDVFHQSQPLTQSSDVTHAVRVVKNVACLSSLMCSDKTRYCSVPEIGDKMATACILICTDIIHTQWLSVFTGNIQGENIFGYCLPISCPWSIKHSLYVNIFWGRGWFIPIGYLSLVFWRPSRVQEKHFYVIFVWFNTLLPSDFVWWHNQQWTNPQLTKILNSTSPDKNLIYHLSNLSLPTNWLGGRGWK